MRASDGGPTRSALRAIENVAWLCLGLLSACHGTPTATRQSLVLQRSCLVDTDCSADQLCLFRVCNTACASDTDCETGARCFDTGRGAACVRLQDNACIVSADCPARTQCMFGRCSTPCEAGTGSGCLVGQSCVDGLCIGGADAGAIAAAGGSGAEPNMSSLAGAGGSSTSASDAGSVAAVSGSAGTSPNPAPCATGSARCEGADVVVCDANGALQVESHCPFACVSGACSGTCAQGTQRCVGNERQTCDATGNFVRTETCTAQCTPSACVSGCREGELECNGMTALRCDAGQFVQSNACQFVCSGGNCGGVCQPGATQCSNGAVASCGADGQWSAPIACLNACNDGSCSGVCRPSSLRCGGNSGFQVCSDSGQWGPTQACYNQACVAGACSGVCTPGSTKCADANSLLSCNAKGQWTQASACSQQACMGGHCTGNCSPSAVRCKSGSTTQTEVCSNAGAWRDGPNCVGQVCDAGICSGMCSSGTRRCDSQDSQRVQVCGSDGKWGSPQACTDGGVCVDSGDCSAPPNCSTGLSPDWYSPAQGGGDSSWNDPRWGMDPVVPFDQSFDGQPGGYIIIFDRTAGTLSVTIRVTLGTSEAPDPGDVVQFGLTTNQSKDANARAASFSLPALDVGEGPQSVTTITTQDFVNGAWQTSNATTPWLTQASAWRGADASQPSWVLSFRVGLSDASIDPTMSVQIALGVQLRGLSTTLSTPVDLATAFADPTSWPQANLSAIACTGEVRLGS